MPKTLKPVATDGSVETAGKSGLYAASADRRTFARVRTAIRGKFLVAAQVDHRNCVVTDISLGGTLVECADAPPVGTEIVLSAEGFDRVKGAVVRQTPDGMAICFESASDAREKMIERLLSYLERGSKRATPACRPERVQVSQARQFTRSSGETVDFDVVDLSLSGANLMTKIRPPVGEFLAIGKLRGRVTRHLEYGIVVEFGIQLRQRASLWSVTTGPV